MKLFDNPELRRSLPFPIARAVDILMAEIEESGAETTADETVNLIESTLCHLGRLWVAEYLELASCKEDAVSADLNEQIFERVSQGKPVLIGQWVALGRAIRGYFEKHVYQTVIEGLADVDFGTPGDSSHPVSRLTSFRNQFSHGSFKAVLREIDEHRGLLHELLLKIPGLRNQPIIVRDSETGLHFVATGNWEEINPPENESIPYAQPIIAGKDGRRINLYPLLQLFSKNGSWDLSPASDKEAYAKLFQKPGLDVWLERYERERRGHLEYKAPEAPVSLPKEIRGKLEESIASSGLILVETRPGCGDSVVVDSIASDENNWPWLKKFGAIGCVAVRPDQLGQSGFTVAQMCLRLIEKALGLEEEHFQADFKNILREDGPLNKALKQLKDSKCEVLLGLDALHHGTATYRGEPWCVLDVYKKLANSPVTVVATMVVGTVKQILFDHRIEYTIPKNPDSKEVAEWVTRLCKENELHGQLLKLLAPQDGELDLFTICDALEEEMPSAERVFEPAVERALWNLRPLLSWRREEREINGIKERVLLWSLFHPVVGDALNEAVPT